MPCPSGSDILRAFFLPIPIALLACATTTETVALAWILVDHPDEDRLELLYVNDTGRRLCLGTEAWPNSAGKLNQMGASVCLIVGARRFPVRDFNTGYCPGGCVRRVEPGETISGSIPYQDFDLPERMRYEAKSLVFSPEAYVCR